MHLIPEYTSPVYGEIIDKNGNFIYNPSTEPFETDSFCYSISDGEKISDKAIVKIKVKQVVNSKFSSVPHYGDLKNYEQYDVKKWDLVEEGDNTILSLNTTDYDPFSGDRPGACNLIKNRVFKGDFIMKARIKSTDDLVANNAADYCIFFAYIDRMNFCYASFSRHDEGESFTAVFKIVDGVRTSIAHKGVAITDNEFHNIELTRKGNEVSCKIDGKQFYKGNDEIFVKKGKIGIGSYNDMACFDDIQIIGDYEVIKE